MLSKSINVSLGLTPNGPLHVGIAAPIYLPLLSEYLDNSDAIEVEGMGGFSVTYLVRALLSLGVKVSIYTLDPRQTKPLLIEGIHLKVYCGHFRKHGRMKDLMRLERKQLEDFMAIDDPDLIHAHWTYEYAWAAVASGKPNLITVRDWSPAILYYRKDLYRLGRFLMDRVVMRRGSNFSVNSPYLYDKVRRVTKQKVLLTPNAIPAEWFLKYDKKRSSTFEIVSINNGFRGRKNVARLIEAFALVRKEFSVARLTLIGHAHELGGEAYLWAQERDLLQNISFKGLLSNSEIMDILDVSDLLAHPALEESFGMTLVEAMARKVPVIGGQSSGAVPWVLDGGQAGKLVDVTDPSAIAAGILEVGRNEAVWAKYSSSGYQHAKNVFHASTVAKQVIQLYHHIIQNR